MVFSFGRKTTVCLVLLFMVLPCMDAAALENTPVFIVADFDVRGISDNDMVLLVDLVSYLIYELKDCFVMNRYERSKLLKGFGYSQTNLADTDIYIEAAELLRSDYLVTGSCIQTGHGLDVKFSLWDVSHYQLVNEAVFRAADFENLVVNSRDIVSELVSVISHGSASDSGNSGIFKSLYISKMAERFLIVLPEPSEGRMEETASARFLINQAVEDLRGNEGYAVVFSSLEYETENPVPEQFADLLAKRDRHTLALIQSEGDKYFLVIYNPDFSERARLELELSGVREDNAGELVRQIEEIPPVPALTLAGELEKEIKIKEKLDLLLFNDKFISRKLWLNIHQSIVKPAVVNKFHPLFNMVSFELDGYWFYSDLLGLSAGYAFSMGYPGTLDSKLASHPLVFQHEIRFSPLVFRSSGPLSVLIELRAAFNIHNAYKMAYYMSIDKYEYTNETRLIMLKAALASGLLYSINDNSSIFINLAEICAVFPFNADDITYDNSNISGAVGGIGFIFRF